MCLICIEFEKERLSSYDAFKNIGELGLTAEHLLEVLDLIKDAQINEMWDERFEEMSMSDETG